MTTQEPNPQSEPITSEPVIVTHPTSTLTPEERILALEKALESVKLNNNNNSNNNNNNNPTTTNAEPATRARFENCRPVEYEYVTTTVPPRRTRSRSRSPSPTRLTIANTHILSNYLSALDTLAEIQTGTDFYSRALVYITTVPVHELDLQKWAFVFKVGLVDTWTQRPLGGEGERGGLVTLYRDEGPGRGRGRYGDQGAFVEERFEDRDYSGGGRGRGNFGEVPIVRLGRIFGIVCDDEEEEERVRMKMEKKDVDEGKDEGKVGEKEKEKEKEKDDKTTTEIKPAKKETDEKVKFIIIIQARSNPSWIKLLIAHSRQSALVAIFHEMINGQNVLFVGAVLQDEKVPVEIERFKSFVLRKVGSVVEAERVRAEEGGKVVPVIC